MGDDAKARTLARTCNEYAAELVRSTPTPPPRYGAFACMPPRCRRHAGRACLRLRCVEGRRGSSVFELLRRLVSATTASKPVWRFERRKALVFVHPTVSPDPTAHALGLPDTLIDCRYDARIAKLHYSNTLRARRTSTISSHMPHVSTPIPAPLRRRGCDEGDSGRERARYGCRYLRHGFIGTPQFPGPTLLEMLRAIVGIDRVLYGSDYPYLQRTWPSGRWQHSSKPRF